MSRRPTIAPEVVAALTASAPRRLVARLDAEPRMAEAWAWVESDGRWTVTTPGGEVVTLEGGEARCSCLLSPRCLHVLATVSVLEVSEIETAESAEVAETTAGQTALEPDQVDAARLAWRAASELLDGGATAAGGVVQAELLRAVHACRASGLHRAAAAGLRVVQSVRDLRAERPEFSLAALAAALFDLLDTARALSNEEASPERIGVARRAYSPIGNLRLVGLFTEPVVAPGYAGVVTSLADGDGRVWTLSDVLPAEAVRAVAAYDAAAGVGDASLAHRALCREGLFVQSATASADGRLGSGAGVKAVRAGASSSWEESEARRLWDVPLGEQIDRAFATDGGLLFARAVVAGADGDALVLAVEHDGGSPVVVRGVAPADHASLAYRDNMRLLARAPGLAVSLVARVLTERPRTAALVAIGEHEGDAGAPRLGLPAAWGGRCNLGLDRLSRGLLSAAEPDPVALRLEDPVDPLDALRRRLLRLVMGGRRTLSPETLATVEREAALLVRRMMPGAAAALRSLAHEACSAGRAVTGARRAGDAGALAEAWLRATSYERAASRVIRRASWT